MSNETQFSIMEFFLFTFGRNVVSTVEPWFTVMNLYMTKSSVSQTIFMAPVTVNYAEKNLDTTKRFL